MAKLSRKGDMNSAGGMIMRGSPNVFANGKPIGLHVSLMSPHPPFGKPYPPHAAAVTTSASRTVYCNGSQVLRVGSGNSCGHSIVQGSNNIFCP